MPNARHNKPPNIDQWVVGWDAGRNTSIGGDDVLIVLSPEECIESDKALLEAIRDVLSERTDNGYPKNNRLSNALWKILELWEDPRN